MATIHVYKTYNFVDKDPIIDKVRTIINDEKMTYQQIHEKSGVSVSCLNGWFHGATRRPQHPTVMAVVHALGYDYRLVKVGGTQPKKKRRG